MPLYGTQLQYEASLFFENLEDNLTFIYNKKDINDMITAMKKLEKTISFIEELWHDMMYQGKFSEYYDKFAKENNEEELLYESDYITFDLDEYYIDIPNGNTRSWIYEKELSDVKTKLNETKKELENNINNYYIYK